MKGFDPKFKDFPDYILGVTHAIWEERRAGAFRRFYAPDIVVRSPASLVIGNEAVIEATLATQAEFPDRVLLGEDVIWCGSPEEGLLSSHRILSTATHAGDGAYGRASGRRLRYRAIADCHARDNRIDDEWLIRDQGAIVRQLGWEPADYARHLIESEGGPDTCVAPFRPEADRRGPYAGRGNANEWGARYAELLTRIMEADFAVIASDYDRACLLEYPAGRHGSSHDFAARFWTGLRVSFPSAVFGIDHRIGREDPLMPPRAAPRCAGVCGAVMTAGAASAPRAERRSTSWACRMPSSGPGACAASTCSTMKWRSGNRSCSTPGRPPTRSGLRARPGRNRTSRNEAHGVPRWRGGGEGALTSPGKEVRVVRYAELVPCRSVFIDAHTPVSDRKENFAIIGAGVSENADQHVHIRETPGFNVGAARQPPGCRNSLHLHRTAEVFFVLEGRWRFFWGRWGSAGEVVLDEGDLFDIPTGIFRGFENVGRDDGMLMAILGGDDAGGGVVWAPQVLDEARAHGLVLGENGRLYDTRRGETLPPGIAPMPPMDDALLSAVPEPGTREVVGGFVARYRDLMALAGDGPCTVIGDEGLIRDRPGFEVEFLTRGGDAGEVRASPHQEVLMVMRGRWRLCFEGGSAFWIPETPVRCRPGCGTASSPRDPVKRASIESPVPAIRPARRARACARTPPAGRPRRRARHRAPPTRFPNRAAGSRPMTRIRSTHVGSLPRSQPVVDFLFAKERGESCDAAAFAACMAGAVSETVRKQVAAGIDIVSDGETSKISYATYVADRYTVFAGDSPRRAPADLKMFPQYLERLARAGGTPSYARPECVGEVRPKGHSALDRDIANLLGAMRAHGARHGFMNAASPGVIALFQPNRYYPSRDAYLGALVDAMQEEYERIAASGLDLQVDCPDLALARHMSFAERSDEEFLAVAAANVEALNHALRNIDSARIRVHICWGNYEGPHVCDIDMDRVFPILMSVRARYVLFEASNPRHGHEWTVFRDRRAEIPDDRILVPGVVDTTTNFVEHPELVAQRIDRFVNLVGAERVVAGSDCGFGTFAGFGAVDPDIAFAKLRSLVEGVRIASEAR